MTGPSLGFATPVVENHQGENNPRFRHLLEQKEAKTRQRPETNEKPTLRQVRIGPRKSPSDAPLREASRSFKEPMVRESTSLNSRTSRFQSDGRQVKESPKVNQVDSEQKTAEISQRYSDRPDREVSDRLKIENKSVPYQRMQEESNNLRGHNSKANGIDLNLKVVGELLKSNEAIVTDVPAVALLSGKLQYVDPQSIPELVSSNPFLKQVLEGDDLNRVLDQPLTIRQVFEALDFGPKTVATAKQIGINLDTVTTPREFLNLGGIDTQGFLAEMKLLRDNLPLDGLTQYIARAKVMFNPKDSYSHQNQLAPIGGLEEQSDQDVALEESQSPIMAALLVPYEVKPEGPLLEPRSMEKSESVARAVPAMALNTFGSQGFGRQYLHLNRDPASFGDQYSSLGQDEQLLARVDVVKTPSPALIEFQATDWVQPQQESLSMKPLEWQSTPQSPGLQTTKQLDVERALRSNSVQSLPLLNDDGVIAPLVSADPFAEIRKMMMPRDSLAEVRVPDRDEAFAKMALVGAMAPVHSMKDSKQDILLENQPNLVEQGSEFGQYQVADSSNDIGGLRSVAFKSKRDQPLVNSEPLNPIQLGHESSRVIDPVMAKDYQSVSRNLSSNGQSFNSESQSDKKDFYQSGGDRIELVQASEKQPQHSASKLERPQAQLHPLSIGARSEMIQQILDKSAMLVKSGGGSMRVSVQTQEMGHLDLAVDVKDAKLDLRIVASSDHVREALVGELPRIRDMLLQQNLTLTSAEVGVSSRSFQQPGQNSFEQQWAQNQQFDLPKAAGQRSWQRATVGRSNPSSQRMAHHSGQIQVLA